MNITPAYLLSKGFILKEDDEQGDNYAHDFYYEDLQNFDLIYVEKELDRNQFAVVFQYTDILQKDFFGYQILIRWNIGCGFVEIPNKFSEMPINYFEMLYEAIRRERL